MSVLKYKDENGEFQPLYLATVAGGGKATDGDAYIKLTGLNTGINMAEIDLSAYMSNLSQITSILGCWGKTSSTSYGTTFYWNRSISPEGYMDAFVISNLYPRDAENPRAKLTVFDGDTATNKLTFGSTPAGSFNTVLIRYNSEV